MDDQKIIELYWRRSEDAIAETAKKYGRYCRRVAYNVLQDHADSEECVNDAYLRAWNAIPPKRPERLGGFLGKITRNLALDRSERRGAEKRGWGQVSLALEELEECIPAPSGGEQAADGLALAELLDRFLAGLETKRRQIFVRRYWYLDSVKEVAAALGVGESSVKMTLLRLRRELKEFLEKEGVFV